jgi:hypothetical protein
METTTQEAKQEKAEREEITPLYFVVRELDAIHKRIDSVEQWFDKRFDKLELEIQDVRKEIQDVRKEIDTKFHWLIGLIFISWVTLIAAIFFKG